jgi:tripartite-type tricarboxylate transporter receptor subunit TctC
MSAIGGKADIAGDAAWIESATSRVERTLPIFDVPTFKEQGIPFVAEASWQGLFAPKGTPKDIVDKINADVNDVLKLPDVQEQMNTLGFRLVGGPPSELSKLLKTDIAKWTKLAASVRPQ